MLELFSPQQVPKPTPRTQSRADRQVVAWTTGDPLPWDTLQPPKPLGAMRRIWQHTVFLGVYDLEATYEHLHRAFHEDKDAYDERAGGRSACAGVLVDENGVLVAESGVLSSALWAVARINNRGVQDQTWADGFPEAAQAFLDAIDESEGARCEASDSDAPPVQDADSLAELLRIAQEVSGIARVPSLATDGIVIRSVAVPAQRGEDGKDIDFLNSFFLEDLAAVRADVTSTGSCGDALAAYLTSDVSLDESCRVDVIGTHAAADGGVDIDRLPKGRWLSDPSHVLSMRQQFAVNQALTDLAPTRGIMGVNGPPGTGKTTMLRDVLAGNVVERARRLATLARPEDAFTSTKHEWTAKDGHRRTVPVLRPELIGFEMVVASANNAAVENVTTEIPGHKAIDSRWRDSADYFPEIASALLASNDDTDEYVFADVKAWGLVAARLGNKRNRSSFHTEFWFDKKDPRTKEPVPDSPPRMQTRLAQWRDGLTPHRDWADARKDFISAEQKVDALIAQRRQAQERLRQLPTAQADERRQMADIGRAQADLRHALVNLDAGYAEAERADRAWSEATTARERHVAVHPRTLETVFTLGQAVRKWRAALAPLDAILRANEAAREQAQARARAIEDHAAELRHALSLAEADHARALQTLSQLRRQTAADKKDLGLAYPDGAWTGDARELRAPWLDLELDAARADLFLAALHLHRDFLANAAQAMSHGLRAALEVVAGSHPPRLDPEKKLAAWQLFFLVVPLISTTFASFGRMFGDVGRESIGWLLVDEAGQASPQYAAGAIWRAQRVITVGDPLQLQPVVTIPKKAQRDIAAAYRISETWIPPQASVQTLADRISRHGTTLKQGDQQVWVSAPLTVHRRCDDPMFTFCNDIAYNGIMVNGTLRDIANPEAPDLFESASGPLIARSHWVDEPALTKGSHLQESQIARFEKALAYLAANNIAPKDVIAISPFRAVADRLEQLSDAYPGLHAGTIHTAQGREAPVVFLVLGGDPGKPGAMAWAASSVNLVNVAASRAKRRLYVIGDRTAWAQQNYFNQLAASLARHQQGPPGEE